MNHEEAAEDERGKILVDGDLYSEEEEVDLVQPDGCVGVRECGSKGISDQWRVTQADLYLLL